MNGFEKRRERKKKDILDSAGVLFFKKGFKDTSVEEISALAAVSPVSVYNFFGTKANLYVKTIEAAFNAAMDAYEKILESENNFQEKLLAFLRYKVTSRTNMSPDYFTSADISNPAVRSVLEKMKEKRVIPFFRRLVDEGKKEGAIDGAITESSVILYLNIVSAGLSDLRIAEAFSRDESLSLGIGKLLLFGFCGAPESCSGSDKSPGASRNN